MTGERNNPHPLSHRLDALHRELLQLWRQGCALHRGRGDAERACARPSEAGLSALRLQLGLRSRPACPPEDCWTASAPSASTASASSCWTVCAFLIGFTGYLPTAWIFSAIFLLRLLSGLAQSPVFPGNGRIVAAWFPTAERGGASAIFNASQYFALVVFAPLFGWLTHTYGWRSCFWFMGLFGFVLAFAWSKLVYNVTGPSVDLGG